MHRNKLLQFLGPQTAAYLLKELAWDWTGAEEENRRAIALDPNNADAHDNLCDVSSAPVPLPATTSFCNAVLR
jgi:hypothetical protein